MKQWVWPTVLDILWLIAFGKEKKPVSSIVALHVDLKLNYAPTPLFDLSRNTYLLF